MKFSVLATGSKANCTYLEYQGKALLIDCGLSAKRTLERLETVGGKAQSIKAILLTHEHSDHIKGVSVLSRKLQIPVYANRATARFLKNVYRVEHFNTGEEFVLDGFDILPFSIVHDAADPVGFTATAGGVKHVQLTDLGRITTVVRSAINDCNSILLESNYDQQRLHECPYPWKLKQRISSSHGHLSNDDASTFLSEISKNPINHVVLGHLSENSNTPELAMATAAKFNDFSRFKNLICGSVDHATPMMSS